MLRINLHMGYAIRLYVRILNTKITMKQKLFLLLFFILPLFSFGQNIYYEQRAEYPGGNDSLIKFISRNVNYPDSSKAYGIQGTVYISFFINEEGIVDDIKVDTGVNKEIDEEAVRVVKLMPVWKPARRNGIPLKVKYTIPIKFNLGY